MHQPRDLLALQRQVGNAAVAARLMVDGRPAVVQRTTSFEPLAGLVWKVKGQWHGFSTSVGAWHVSIFPTGTKGKRTFDDFHVTKEALGEGNKHHFYTDDGHVALLDLRNVDLGARHQWAIANRLAAEFYQRRLGLHVTAEMLEDEITRDRRGGVRRTMKEHLVAVEAEVRARQEAMNRVVVPSDEVIDMFADSEEDTPTPVPVQAPLLVQQPPQPFGPTAPQQPAYDPRPVYTLHQEFTGHARALANQSEERYRVLGDAVDKLTVMFVQLRVSDVGEMRRLYESTLRAFAQ